MKFSHIYLESEIKLHPRTQEILKKFPESKIIEINDYKNIFNRSYQNFQAQKFSSRLILAKKKDQYYYKGSNLTDQFHIPNFYYNSLILNCVYNCDYCYLQGMYNSGHTVIFVNLEDFFDHTDQLLRECGSLYLCISYDTDILAFESTVSYTSDWIKFAESRPNLTLEVRTKSNLYSKISSLNPISNVILAWTLSPSIIIKEYEKKTPTLKRRIESLQKAIQDGWKVRICLDPILYTKEWEKIYLELIEYIFSFPELQKIHDISIGTFRINSDYLKKIRKMRSDSKILFFPFQKENTAAVYPKNLRENMLNTIKNKITEYIPENRIFQ